MSQTPENQSGPSLKKPYATPRLTTFGAVHVLTQSSSSGSSEGSKGNPPFKTTCDVRAKDRIVRIGTHPLGIGLYLFEYKPQFQNRGSGRQFGVMANEVEAVMPSAVEIDAEGYKTVDLAALGVVSYLH